MVIVEPIMGVKFWDPSVAIETEDVKITFRQLMGEYASLDRLTQGLDAQLPAEAAPAPVAATPARTASMKNCSPKGKLIDKALKKAVRKASPSHQCRGRAVSRSTRRRRTVRGGGRCSMAKQNDRRVAQAAAAAASTAISTISTRTAWCWR